MWRASAHIYQTTITTRNNQNNSFNIENKKYKKYNILIINKLY